MEILPIILLHLFTLTQTFIIAWAYSRTGSDGITKLFTKRFDHTPHNVERGLILVIAGCWYYAGMKYHDVWLPLIGAASWLACFPLLQQFFHNASLKKFCVERYENNIEDSKKSTAWFKFTVWQKVFFCFCGVVGPIVYLILK